jgi:hypothetical protein
MNRKIILLAFCLAIFSNSLFAQLFSEAGVTTVFPLDYFKSQVDFGFGPHLNIGYCINNNIDVALACDYQSYSTMIPDFKIISGSIIIKYKVPVGKYAPYLGLKPGVYQSKLKPFENETISNNAFGFAPLLGVKIDTGISNKLKFDISTSYSLLFFKSKYEYMGLDIGMVYLF